MQFPPAPRKENMPLWKTPSGTDKLKIQPNTWTYVKFASLRNFPMPADGWSLVEATLRVEYPKTGCPKTLRGHFIRVADLDDTGNNDVNPIAGMVRHHHWQHFLLNTPGLVLGFRVWHNGTAPITIDGRQFKTIAFTPKS